VLSFWSYSLLIDGARRFVLKQVSLGEVAHAGPGHRETLGHHLGADQTSVTVLPVGARFGALLLRLAERKSQVEPRLRCARALDQDGLASGVAKGISICSSRACRFRRLGQETQSTIVQTSHNSAGRMISNSTEATLAQSTQSGKRKTTPAFAPRIPPAYVGSRNA